MPQVAHFKYADLQRAPEHLRGAVRVGVMQQIYIWELHLFPTVNIIAGVKCFYRWNHILFLAIGPATTYISVTAIVQKSAQH